LHRQAHRGEDAQPVGRAAQLVDRVLGMGHQAEHVAPLVAHARDVVCRAVEVLSGGIAQHDLAVLVHRRERWLIRVVPTPGVLGGNAQGQMAAYPRVPAYPPVITSPLAAHAQVNAVSLWTTSRSTCLKVKRRFAFGSKAPGRRCASHRTWKPLQIPSTRPPSSAKEITDSITGENRAIAPALR